MLESPRPRLSLHRLTRAIGPVVGGLTLCLTLGSNNAPLSPAPAPASAPDLHAGTGDDLQRDLECLLRRLMGLACDPDPSEDPPAPNEPIEPPGLI